VSVQLVNVADSSHLWSETYDRTLEDIFAVQDDIAHSVVKELRTTLLGEADDSDASGAARRTWHGRPGARHRSRGTPAYLLARHLIDRSNHEDTTKGIEYLKQALAEDPEFALAWAELSRAYQREADIGWTPAVEGYGRAREAAERALALEPDLPEAHARMARTQMLQDWDWRGAEASLARALELAPANTMVLRIAGTLSQYLGRLEEAIGFYRRALEQDPLSGPTYYALGYALYAAGRFEEAEATLSQGARGSPANDQYTLGPLMGTSLRWAEAKRHWRRRCGNRMNRSASRRSRSFIRCSGHGAESETALRELIEKYSDTMACQIAEGHAVRRRGG
jgi:tetratricopeptide (TPR) repeat protein